MSSLLRLFVIVFCSSVFVSSEDVSFKNINISMSMVLEKVEEMTLTHALQISELNQEIAELKMEHRQLETEISFIKDQSSRHSRALEINQNIAFTSYLNHDEHSIGQNQVVVFNKEILNDGNGYSIYTGVFTAPIAGVYHFNFFIGVRDENQMYVILSKNGVNMVDGVAETIEATHDAQGGNAANLKLAKGDAVFVKHLSPSVGTNIEGSSSVRISTFSGFLLYPLGSNLEIVGK